MPLTQITGEGVGTTSTTATLAVGNTTITGAATYTTSLKSTTALATPAALTATQATAFASTVSGASIMGFGTTNDVSLMNRAGTVCLGVGPNTTAVNMTGALSVTGAISSATSVALTGVTNNVGTITSGVWNAGAITTAGAFSLTGGSSMTLAVGGTSAVLIDANSNYNVISLNNTASLTTGVGLAGGASGDAASLYHMAASGGLHYFRSGGTDYMWLSAAGALSMSTSISATYLYTASNGSSTGHGIYIGTAGTTNSSIIARIGSSSGYDTWFYGDGTIRTNGTYVNTTGAGANVYIDQHGYLYRSTSSLRFKADLEPLNPHRVSAILTALAVGDGAGFTYRGVGSRDDQRTRFIGWAAETVADIDPLLVHRDSDGSPAGVMYERATVYLAHGWQQHDATIATLTIQNTALEARIATLEAQLAQ